MISTRKFNEPTLPKLYADDINIIVNDSLKQGGFSHIKKNDSGIGGDWNNSKYDGKLFKGQCNKCGKKVNRMMECPNKYDKVDVND